MDQNIDPSKLSNAQVTFIQDESGNTIDTTAPSEATAEAWKTNKTLYKNDEGQWVNTPVTKVEISENGDINVLAPRAYFQNESFKNLLDENVLTQVSKLYKANAEAKIPNPFSDKEGEEITIPEFIGTVDKALGEYAGIQRGASIQRYLSQNDLGEDAENLTENQFIMMNTSATEPGAKDSSLISVPTGIINAFPKLKESESYKNNYISKGDFNNNLYSLEKSSRDDIHKIHDIVDEYFNKKDFSDLDEYARMYAFRNYIKNIEPSMGFWNSAGLNIEAVAGGVVTGVAKFATGAANLLETAWNGLMWAGQFVNPVTAFTGVKEFGKTAGASNFFKGLDEGLQQHIDEQKESYAELSKSVAAAYSFSTMGGEIAANIITGKWVANLLTNAALLKTASSMAGKTGAIVDATNAANIGVDTSKLIGAVNAGRSTADVIREGLMLQVTGSANPSKLQLLKTLATTDGSNIYNAINSMIKANTAAAWGAETFAQNVVQGTSAFTSAVGASADASLLAAGRAAAASEALKNTIDTSLVTMRNALNASEVQNFFAQVAIDTASTDALAWRKYLDGDPDAEDVGELLWRTGTNAGIYAGALGIGRLMTKFPNTEVAQKANVKARQKVYSAEQTVAKWNQDIKDHLPEVLKKQSTASKRAAQYSDLMRGADKIVAETGDISKKIALESAVDNMWFGVNNRLAQYNSDYYPLYKSALTSAGDAEKGLTKLMNQYGIQPEPSVVTTGKDVPVNLSVPQDIIDYWFDYDAVRRINTYTPEGIAEEKEYGRDLIKTKEVAEARMAKTSEKYPDELLGYVRNTWGPAYQGWAYQITRVADEKDVLDRVWHDKVVDSKHFGDSGELWMPAKTITDYQVLQASARNSLSRELVGDVPNKNKPEQWNYSYDGKEHHYMHPNIVVTNYARGVAGRDLRRELLGAGVNVYGKDILATGPQNRAAQVYKKNSGAIDKSVSKAVSDGVAKSLKESNLGTEIIRTLDTKKQAKKVQKRVEKIKDLDTADIVIKKTNKLSVVNTLDDESLRAMLGNEAIENITQTDEQYKEFWKNASRSQRKIIRQSLANTSKQTGWDKIDTTFEPSDDIEGSFTYDNIKEIFEDTNLVSDDDVSISIIDYIGKPVSQMDVDELEKFIEDIPAETQTLIKNMVLDLDNARAESVGRRAGAGAELGGTITKSNLPKIRTSDYTRVTGLKRKDAPTWLQPYLSEKQGKALDLIAHEDLALTDEDLDNVISVYEAALGGSTKVGRKIVSSDNVYNMLHPVDDFGYPTTGSINPADFDKEVNRSLLANNYKNVWDGNAGAMLEDMTGIDIRSKINPEKPLRVSKKTSTVTYEDFMKAKEFDPDLTTNLNKSILNNKIKKECL